MSEEQVEVVRRGWEGFEAGMARGDPAAWTEDFDHFTLRLERSE